MPTSITKLAPQAVVLAAALYWSWPALQECFPRGTTVADNAAPTKSAGPREFAGASLSPTFLSPSSRHLFLLPGAKRTTMAKSGKPVRHGTTEKGAAEIPSLGLVLNATCIVGEQRLAIINGHIYKEKESIPRSGDDATSCVVTSILPHKVLLSCQGESLQLGYANVAAKPAAGDGPRKSAK
jgi:hypothetical protein